jgi:hypothetical protein
MEMQEFLNFKNINQTKFELFLRRLKKILQQIAYIEKNLVGIGEPMILYWDMAGCFGKY